MLSRVADSLFWLGRNVERAETIARILDVNYTRAMDLYSQRDGRSEKLWRSVMQCAGFVNEPNEETSLAATDVFGFCAFDEDNSTSIVSAVRIARTNALGVRAELTTEVWELINVLYLYVEEQQKLRSVMREGPSQFLRRLRDRAQAFAGISDATMSHGDGWNFIQVGRYLERAYLTARILDAIDVPNEPWHESQRMLEMCCASAPFAQASHHAPEARDATAFVVLSETFPRSLRFCTREIDEAMHRISRSPRGTFAIDAERRVGRLRSQLDYTPIDDLLADGVSEFARGLVREYELLTSDIEASYFPRLPVPA
jgi:uncharacterized alpha-E superfamily protein